MPEFSKEVRLPAARLSREDLLTLGRLLSEGMEGRITHSKFSLREGDAEYQSSSIDELLSQELPSSIHGLWFAVNTSNGNAKAVRISLNRSYAILDVRSSDQIWFNGKMHQIKAFFAKRKRWYAGFRMIITSLFSGFAMLAWLAWLVSILSEASWSIIWLGVALIFIGLTIADFKGRLLPVAEIHLAKKRVRPWREAAMLVLTGVAAVGTVAGVLIQLFEKAK